MDPMSRFDERQASEAKSEVNRMKADAMRMIERMSDEAFEAWYAVASPTMDDGITQAHNAREARRFQFAAATRGHEEPAW